MKIYKIAKCKNCGTIQIFDSYNVICKNCLNDSLIMANNFEILYESFSKYNVKKYYRKHFAKQNVIDNFNYNIGVNNEN